MPSYDPDSGVHRHTARTGLALRQQIHTALHLDTPAQIPELNTLAEEMGREAGLPVAMVNVIGDDQQFRGLWCDPEADLPDIPTSMPLTQGYCPHTLHRPAALVTKNILGLPRFSANPATRLFKAYAGASIAVRIDPTGAITPAPPLDQATLFAQARARLLGTPNPQATDQAEDQGQEPASGARVPVATVCLLDVTTGHPAGAAQRWLDVISRYRIRTGHILTSRAARIDAQHTHRRTPALTSAAAPTAVPEPR
jgi:hypothetical protein